MELAIWNWLLTNLPAITGVAKVVKGFPSFARGAITAPSIALVQGDLAMTGEGGNKRVGGQQPFTLVWLVMVFAQDEQQKIATNQRVREWCAANRTIDPNGSGARVPIRLARGEPHVPETDTEIERYAYTLQLETDI